ncbi:hypothetical protein [Sphaerisporangium fuscum]|uniref:hypothetical protein n=1 Tax=Sphaerisporangium fuscum TaxID=2835868 RepID=UPI001BDD11CA|nr:hypothetical protein [Sphaerisporangium fuscum]
MGRSLLVLVLLLAGCTTSPPLKETPHHPQAATPYGTNVPLPGGLPQHDLPPLKAKPARCVQPSSTAGDIRPLYRRSGWVKVSTLPRANLVDDFDVAPDGAVWMQTQWLDDASGRQETQIRRWYANEWQDFPRPSIGPPGGVNYVGVLGAASARQVWAFGSTIERVEGVIEMGNSRMFLGTLQDGRWSDVVFTAPETRGIQAEVGILARGTWAFAGDPVALHWDGSGWKSHKLRGTLGVVDVGGEGDNIWALRGDRDAPADQPTLIRWMGRGWQPILLPALGGPALGSTPEAFPIDVAANAPDDVWVTGFVEWGMDNEDDDYEDGPLRARPVALHWDGAAWTCLWGPMSWVFDDAEPDGRGGLWVVASQGGAAELWHLSGGRWTRTRLPAGKGQHAFVSKLVKRAGTSEVYAAGYIGRNVDYQGSIDPSQHATLWRIR